MLLLLLLFILGLYQCVGFCVCVRAVSRLAMIVSDYVTGVVIVLERPHHREQQENDEQIATVTEDHSTV